MSSNFKFNSNDSYYKLPGFLVTRGRAYPPEKEGETSTTLRPGARALIRFSVNWPLFVDGLPLEGR